MYPKDTCVYFYEPFQIHLPNAFILQKNFLFFLRDNGVGGEDPQSTFQTSFQLSLTLYF